METGMVEGKIAIETTTIDHYGSLKDWINEASDEKYWTALVQCLLHSDAPLPERPPTWGPTPRRSTLVYLRHLLRPPRIGITTTQMLDSPQHRRNEPPPSATPTVTAYRAAHHNAACF